MNKLRLTNVIENHFYLDFNWKDGCAVSSVSQGFSGPIMRFSRRDTDETHEWSVSWQRKREKRISGQRRPTNSPIGLSVSTRFRR